MKPALFCERYATLKRRSSTALHAFGFLLQVVGDCYTPPTVCAEFGSREWLRATDGAARWRWLAAIPSILGFAVALRCVWDFGWTGRATPAPIAPPQRLVVVGFYRYVRTPMYVGFAAGWIGLWVIFRHPDPKLIATVAAVAPGVHLFVAFYEEPTLPKKFGAAYEEYRRNVRW